MAMLAGLQLVGNCCIKTWPLFFVVVVVVVVLCFSLLFLFFLLTGSGWIVHLYHLLHYTHLIATPHLVP